MAPLVGHCSAEQKLASLVCMGEYERQWINVSLSPQCFSPYFCLSLALSLKTNKICFKKRLIGTKDKLLVATGLTGKGMGEKMKGNIVNTNATTLHTNRWLLDLVWY